MSARTTFILDIDKRLYAVGLEWGGRGNYPTIAASAAARAEQAKAPLVVLRDNPKQFGMAWPIDGSGMPTLLHPWYSAAAAIALKHRSKTIGCWRLPNGHWWLLVIGIKGILPDGDVVFPSEQAAREAFEHKVDAFNYITRYAPEHWGVNNRKSEDFTDLLHDKHGPKLKRPAKQRQSNVKVRAIGTAAAIGVGAVLLYLLLPSRHPIRKVDTKPPVPALQYADSRFTAYNCLNRMTLDQPALIKLPLYTAATARCANNVVTYTLKPDVAGGGTAPVPLAHVRNTYVPNAIVEADGSLTLTTPPLGPETPATVVHPTTSLPVVEANLRATADSLLGTLHLTPPPAAVTGAGDWKILQWSMETTAPAPKWAAALTGDLVKIRSITRTFSAGIYTWNIEADSYVTR